MRQTLSVCSVHAAQYRSLRAIDFPVGALTLFLGANGVGKTNLYRALQLLQAAALGTLAYELAAEGGMESAMWAGARPKNKPAQIRLCARFSGPGDPENPLYSYEIAVGFAPPAPPGRQGAFPLEPQVKEELLAFHHRGRVVKLLERRGPAAFGRDAEGKRREITDSLMASGTALGAFDEPQIFPEVHGIRSLMADWRFYHDLRTDPGSPLRRPCLAVASSTLASDGANLAALLATLTYIRGDTVDLNRAIEDAFPGAALAVPLPGREASFGMVFPDHPHRVFTAAELSDGTLRYLALTGALLGLRLPSFIALNEPESSLHPDLLEPLARLIVNASRTTQVWLVTHSERLAAAVEVCGGVAARTVIKRGGQTWIDGLKPIGSFADEN